MNLVAILTYSYNLYNIIHMHAIELSIMIINITLGKTMKEEFNLIIKII